MRLADGLELPVVWSRTACLGTPDCVVVDHPRRLDTLARLDDYPNVLAMLEGGCLAELRRHGLQVRPLLAQGIYIFGAYKVGLRVARMARQAGLVVLGFLDNDPAKDGRTLENAPIHHPAKVALDDATVVIASGQHSNAIHAQLSAYPGLRLVNLHEFLYAVDAVHVTGPFSATAEAPARDQLPHLSAFLRLDDEHSRHVFDALVGMRTGLSIQPATAIRSPAQEEYFEPAFVAAAKASRFVDGGAAAGDTLRRLEARYGPVEYAWLFEPELPSYYEALKALAERPEALVFNMGLDAVASRARYRPELAYDIAGEIEYTLPTTITSYIQGVPLDAVVPGPVGFIKLDIEGMEANALRGARTIIARDRPTLAVCAYHRPDDYWHLMDEVLSIAPDYRVGMRLYADVLEDITLYFH